MDLCCPSNLVVALAKAGSRADVEACGCYGFPLLQE
jgi:hypothetical protein